MKSALAIVPSVAVTFAFLAAPAAGQDDTYDLPPSQGVGFGNVKVRGYSLSGTVTKTKGGGTQIFLSLFKTDGGSTQTHNFSWNKDVKLNLAHDLSAGQINAGLGDFGKLAMQFHPTRDVREQGPGKGCTGKKGKTRRGRVEGTFNFTPDKDFFGTVKADHIKATAYRTPGRTCKSQEAPDPGTGPITLSTTGPGGLNFFAQKSGGKVTENVFLTTRAKNPAVHHFVSATSRDGSKFAVADNASSATVQGLGEFLSGRANYTATDYFENGSSGKLSGDFAVKIDGVGTRRPFTAGDVGAFLSKPGFTPPPPPNQAPTADFSSSEGVGPRQIDFFDGSFDPDGTVVSWAWEFGDGSTSTQQNPTHTYATAGTYTVRLTVTDEDGATGTTTQSVTVTDPPPEEGP